ncbi:hypothetical protein SDC9_52199 [bioreactor metagenome]|uniref:Uncharacterized protein n=1 Tax=bioreactor metagenome TaxID=1076179 RepID=A0A644WV01_9ZZZZ
MCLLITALAAIITTIVWYVKISKSPNKVGSLCLIYWGASLMWLVDALFCLAEGEPFWDISLNDALLGFTVVLCGLAAWVAIRLLKWPKKKFYFK